MSNDTQYIFDIDIKGELPYIRNNDEGVCHAVHYEYRGGRIVFSGTEKEVSDFIGELYSQNIKVIGYTNRSETFIEVSPAVDEDGMPTGKYLVTDIENKSKGYYVSKKQLLSILNDDYRKSFTETRFDRKGYYVLRDKLKTITNETKD